MNFAALAVLIASSVAAMPGASAPDIDVNALVERLKNPDQRAEARAAIIAHGLDATPT